MNLKDKLKSMAVWFKISYTQGNAFVDVGRNILVWITASGVNGVPLIDSIWTGILVAVVIIPFLGYIWIKGHGASKEEETIVKFQTVYQKNNYDVQKEILDTLKEIKELLRYKHK